MTRSMHLRTLGLSAIFSLTSVGCGLEAIGEGGDDGPSIPAEVQTAFDQTCATSTGCHAAGSALVVLEAPETGAILEASSPAGGAYVTLGDLDNSYIAQKILGGPNISGGIMPPSPQSDNDDLNRAIIIGWIAGVPLEGEETGDGDGDGETDTDTTDTDDSGGMAQTCYIESVPAVPSFEADIWPILEARCGTSGCHADALGPLMPDAVSAYDNMVGVAGATSPLNYIEAESPDASYLWHKISATQASSLAMGGGSTMPIGGEMCGIEFQAIYGWIASGAML